ncbi:MAG: YihY/virulence factor BrkB family protein [Peptoniphilaceae bacterium]|nr:YihY/virulence factor BrkB family protein [Peptoniphilaceae bacterium]MDD7383578.1 YihY/virulence factor BrkB family protein [Peptoniphilaceae bacterium]MDY3738750.1 YihY/virulence factor BrkB family protein [Peptoniphilaceae bacterium]
MEEKKVSKKEFISLLFKEISKDEITFLSAQTAYYFIMSLVPMLIVIINIISIFAQNQLDNLFEFFKILPDSTLIIMRPIVENIINSRSNSLLSMSLIVSIWSSSNAITSLINSLNKAFGLEKNKNFVIGRLKSIFFTLILSFVILTVLIFTAYGNAFLSFIKPYLKQYDYVFNPIYKLFLQYLIPILAMIFSFTSFFRYAPNFKKTERLNFKSSFIGSLIATIGWLILSIAFSFYITNISSMSVIYGSLVGIFALFIWFNLSSMIIIFAGEFAFLYEKLFYNKKIQE